MKKSVYIIAGCSMLLIGILFFNAWRRSRMYEAILRVQETFWQRRVYVEEYLPDTVKAWADAVPDSVRKISSEIVPKGTNYVLRVETYTEMEKYQTNSPSPVYNRQPFIPTYAERPVTKTRNIWAQLTANREMVTYVVRQWKEANETKAATITGDETKEPVWVEPVTDGITTRPGRRTEYYSVVLATIEGEPKTYNRSVSFEDWKTFKKEQQVKARFYSQDGEPLIFSKIN